MNQVTILLSTFCALNIAEGQLFPFPNLRHYIDLRFDASEITNTTKLPHPADLDKFRYPEGVMLPGGRVIALPHPQIKDVTRVEKTTKHSIVIPTEKYPDGVMLPGGSVISEFIKTEDDAKRYPQGVMLPGGRVVALPNPETKMNNKKEEAKTIKPETIMPKQKILQSATLPGPPAVILSNHRSMNIAEENKSEKPAVVTPKQKRYPQGIALPGGRVTSPVNSGKVNDDGEQKSRLLNAGRVLALLNSDTIDRDGKENNMRTIGERQRSKYVPHRLMPEPNVDPNTKWVPSIGINESKGSSTNHRLTVTLKPSTSPTKTKSQKILQEPNQQQATNTLVESIPALSVSIPSLSSGIGAVNTNEGLLDYLVPPIFPSVYENHVNQLFELPPPFQTAIKVTVPPTVTTTTTTTTLKPRKSTKSTSKRRKPFNTEKTSTTDTEKRRNRFRPSRLRTKTTEKPQEDEPVSEATNLFPEDFKPYQNKQYHIQKNTEPVTLESSPGERVEFQLHGQNGPETYKFGFDTGDVKNRHFRYEEKDHQGNVKGHYGYYDKTGKLQVINYHADENGFHATQV